MALPVDAPRLEASAAAPAPFAAHAPFAALRWCLVPPRASGDGSAQQQQQQEGAAAAAQAATPLAEAARLLGRSPEALLDALRGAGDVPLGGDAVWVARSAQLPPEWRVSARAQRRTLITAAALLVYIRARMRPDRTALDAAVRAAVDALRGGVPTASSPSPPPLPPPPLSTGRPLRPEDTFARVRPSDGAVVVFARPVPTEYTRDAFIATVLQPLAAALGCTLLVAPAPAAAPPPPSQTPAAPAVYCPPVRHKKRRTTNEDQNGAI